MRLLQKNQAAARPRQRQAVGDGLDGTPASQRKVIFTGLATWPSGLAESPYQKPELGRRVGPTLCIFCLLGYGILRRC